MHEIPVQWRPSLDLKPPDTVRGASDSLAVVAAAPATVNCPAAGPVTAICPAVGSVATDRTRILVVDDDERICELLSRVLQRSDYHVMTAESAEDALGLLTLHVFDLVICDMQLGGMSGLDLTDLVVNLYPDIPVILMTARRDTDLMRAALRKGAADFMPKPFDSETIPIIIERSLERRALNQERVEEHRQNQIFSNVQVLAAAIDAKEPYTAEHSRRVARLSRATAEAMDLPYAEQQSVDWAAQVHDVGKIATPDHILLKSGRLTDDEWRVIRQHPLKGAQIVGHVQDLQYVAGIVRSHHERIDGNGYPDGLCGDRIPLLARIISVADAFEVMTSNRVYRSRISEAEAISRLKAGLNTQFDTRVVAAFASLSSEARR